MTARSFTRPASLLAAALLATTLVQATAASAANADNAAVTTHYGSLEIQGIDIAYREAGHPANPAIVLLHGK